MRLLFYSHDSYGLGHIRRTLHVAGRLLRDVPGSSALVVTGAPRAHYFAYPPRCDYLKLPSVSKGRDGRYIPRDLGLPLDRLLALRGRLLRDAARGFRPDVLFVDHAPRGLEGELLPTLEDLGRRRRPPLRVLGLRDIIDDPAAVRRTWRREATRELLLRHYDLVLVYGQRDLFDPVREYDLPPSVARLMQFVGYVGPPASPGRRGPELRRRLAPRTGRLVVVSAGGGGDGKDLLRGFLDGYARRGTGIDFEAVLVTGPLMSPRKRRRLRRRAERTGGVTLLEHAEDLPELFAAADFAVSMGGYNSVCELSAAGVPALIVPRVFPRREQLHRARLLAARGLVRFLHPREAGPEELMAAVRHGLEAGGPPPAGRLDLGGLDRVSLLLRRVLRERRAAEEARRLAGGPLPVSSGAA